MSLYRHLLRDQWHAVAPAIQRMHAHDAPVNASGRFRIRHGACWIARALVRLAGLPPAAEDVPTRLTITPTGNGETWLRSFHGARLVSIQRALSPGVLAERFGRLELRFRLEVLDGGIVYRQSGAAFCIGRFRLPLPHWLAPQISAWERPSEHRGCADVSVVVSAPLTGFLIAYEGSMEPEAPRPAEEQAT